MDKPAKGDKVVNNSKRAKRRTSKSQDHINVEGITYMSFSMLWKLSPRQKAHRLHVGGG